MKTARLFTVTGCRALLALLIFSAMPALAAGAAPAPAPAPAVKFVEVAASADTLRLLRGGGYALYLRHGRPTTPLPTAFPAST